MERAKRRLRQPIWKIIKTVLLGVVVILIAVAIIGWTRALQRKDRLEQQKEVLEEVLKGEGEQGLLERAGVTVNEIFYGEPGLSVFIGGIDAYTYSAEEMRNIAIYEIANRSVVHITTITVDLNSFLEVLPAKGTGSGIIINEDGYILTNAHVVESAKGIEVKLHDGTSYQGTLVGQDIENDLAVLKIKVPSDVQLKPIIFGESKSLKVGQKVAAIGNPFGYDRTMTTGTISGLGRPVRVDSNIVINGMIQTDASINPGNSGGPLLNSKGEMVGICTTIHSTSGQGQGVSFAIPVETAIAVIPDLIRHGKVIRGWLDATLVQLEPSIVKHAELNTEQGLLVSQVRSGGKAEKSGLRGGTQQVQYGTSIIYLGGDVIVEINGIAVGEYNDLYSALTNTQPGDKVEMVVIRGNQRSKLKVELITRPERFEWTLP
ncbi:MAG: trypsin-like peptidase domain-containing protein [Sphaerochaetaceae bacterium]|nr:trypsin-like peptidase domain-containing protein [Sphaerochaetaceae bacterium]